MRRRLEAEAAAARQLAGRMGPADPALDLVAAWHLLEAGPRQALRAALRGEDLEWERGQAWAFEQAMGAVWYYADSNPAMSQMGRRTLERILADRRYAHRVPGQGAAEATTRAGR